jgi:haloacetate dehalogenase
MGAEAYADYRRAVEDEETVHSMLEDYRAGVGIDREHDEQARAAGRRIGCPTLVLWSAREDLEQLYGEPVAIWRAWCDDVVRGVAIDSGHHMAEEAPTEAEDALRAFLGP